MTLGAFSRSVFVAGLFVGGFMATYTVEMDSLCVILQSFLMAHRSFALFCLWFPAGLFVAFDAVFDIIADFQAFNRLVVLIMMAFTATNLVINYFVRRTIGLFCLHF